MAISRTGLKLTDGSTEYDFPIAIDGDGKQFITIEPKPWEPGDISQEFRVPLHPWDEGVGPNRMDYDITFNGQLIQRPNRKYALANMDCSWAGIMVPPPLLTAVAIDASHEFARIILFNGNQYFIGQNGSNNVLYKLGSNLSSISAIKDFAADIVYNVAVFNNELIFAMGPTTKIWTMDTSEVMTQATDNVYISALGRVGDTLWGDDSSAGYSNKLFSCTTAPRTLASWTPASPNQYTVGDSGVPIREILDYGGIPAVIKGDGAYFPDAESEFYNQTPQLSAYGTLGVDGRAFTAWGYLWIPSKAGLLRVTYGESIPFGPQLAGMPKFNMQINGGVEWAGDIYLLVSPYGTSDSTCSIFKMTGTGESVVFHQIAQFGSSLNTGRAIAASPVPTNPVLFLAVDSNFYYMKLGRGGGKHIDDANYAWGTSQEWRSGAVAPFGDVTVESVLVGISAVVDTDSSESFTFSYDMDESGSFTNFLTTQDGGGTAPVTNTGKYVTAYRYASTGAVGQTINVKVTGTSDAGTGVDRPEIREMWIFGYGHPRLVDNYTIGLYADRRGRVRGIPVGRRAGETMRLFRNWMENGSILTMELNDFEDTRTVRVRVVGVKKDSISVRADGRSSEVNTDLVTVILRRTDYASNYAD